jgi:hypothetical protein
MDELFDDYVPEEEVIWQEDNGMAEVGIDEDGWFFIRMGLRKIVLREEELFELSEAIGKVL